MYRRSGNMWIAWSIMLQEHTGLPITIGSSTIPTVLDSEM